MIASTQTASSTWRHRFATLALQALATGLPAQGQTPPTLPAGSQALQVPAGNAVSFHTYAVGVQIYRYDAAAAQWVFVAPQALLFADAGCHAVVGVHGGGPTWTSTSGSSIVGQRLASATVDPTAIPWLLLEAVSTTGPGVLARTTYVQRVNTIGGRAPSAAGTPDQITMVPYAAEYVFYRAQPIQ